MEKETLYKFFDGKASREEKEAVRIWLESSPENEQMLFREREFFDAMILSGSTKSAGGCPKSRIAPFAIVYFGKKYYLTVAKTKHYSNG